MQTRPITPKLLKLRLYPVLLERQNKLSELSRAIIFLFKKSHSFAMPDSTIYPKLTVHYQFINLKTKILGFLPLRMSLVFTLE